MFYLIWESSLETGIDVIDSQHRRIVDYINQLHGAIARGDNAIVARVIDQMVDYTKTHFAFEEELMAKAGYHQTEAHTAIHNAFADRIEIYKQRFLAGDDISKRLLSDLRIWLTNHIKHEDGDYARVVKAYLRIGTKKTWLAKTLDRLFGATQ